jgi:hypothetical protein
MAGSVYVDPQGYGIDPERNLRRRSGEQEIILKRTEECFDIEWSHLLEAILDCLPKIKG